MDDLTPDREVRLRALSARYEDPFEGVSSEEAHELCCAVPDLLAALDATRAERDTLRDQLSRALDLGVKTTARLIATRKALREHQAAVAKRDVRSARLAEIASHAQEQRDAAVRRVTELEADIEAETKDADRVLHLFTERGERIAELEAEVARLEGRRADATEEEEAPPTCRECGGHGWQFALPGEALWRSPRDPVSLRVPRRADLDESNRYTTRDCPACNGTGGVPRKTPDGEGGTP